MERGFGRAEAQSAEIKYIPGTCPQATPPHTSTADPNHTPLPQCWIQQEKMPSQQHWQPRPPSGLPPKPRPHNDQYKHKQHAWLFLALTTVELVARERLWWRTTRTRR